MIERLLWVVPWLAFGGITTILAMRQTLYRWPSQHLNGTFNSFDRVMFVMLFLSGPASAGALFMSILFPLLEVSVSVPELRRRLQARAAVRKLNGLRPYDMELDEYDNRVFWSRW